MAKKRGRATNQRAAQKPSRVVSGIIGGVLIGLAGVWVIWLLLHQFGTNIPLPPGLPAQNPTPVSQISPLVAEGITLAPASQSPALSQKQALLIASQLEPDAAATAGQITAQYLLVTYPNTVTPAAHPDLHNTLCTIPPPGSSSTTTSP